MRHDTARSSTSSQGGNGVGHGNGAATGIAQITNRRTIQVGDAREIVVRPRISPWYKLLLGCSLGLNILILALLLTVGADAYRFSQALSREVTALAAVNPEAEARIAKLRDDPAAAAEFSVDLARRSVGEALGAVQQMEGATIRAQIPIDQQLPLQLQVPIDQDTVVAMTAPVPLQVPARITFPGNGGYLDATVALNLPAGMQLPVHLGLSVPLSTTVPVRFDVPVSIPIRETELQPPFERLRRLLAPAAELLSRSQQ